MNSLQAIIAASLLVTTLSAADLTVKVADHEPPKEINEAIRARLEPKSIQVLKGSDTVFEFWLNSQTPFTAKPDTGVKAFQSLKEGTLLGAAVVHGAQRDFRDDDLSE